MTYIQVFEDEVPVDLRWDIPPHHANQAQEVAYADEHHGAEPAVRGDRWKRVIDRSSDEVTYWRKVDDS